METPHYIDRYSLDLTDTSSDEALRFSNIATLCMMTAAVHKAIR